LLDQRLAAGAVSATEVTAYKLALNRANFEMGDARRLAAIARAHVAEAMGLPASALEGVDLPQPPAADGSPGLDLAANTLRQAALRGRADVLSSLAEYEATQSALQLEIARQYPDIHLGNGYQWDQGESKWSLALTAELPLLNQNRGPIAEAEARRGEAAARLLALQARVIAGVDSARINHEWVIAQLAQARALVEAQEQRERAIAAAQEAGGADLLEVESARLESLTGRLVLLEVQQRLQQAAGQLEDALQRPFTGLSVVEFEPPPRAESKSP
jgi:outer membrane protein TolC